MRLKLITRMSAILAILLTASCGQDDTDHDLINHVEKLKKRRTDIEKSIVPTKAKTLIPAEYAPNKSSEPFHSISTDTSKKTSGGSLQSFPLAVLQFVGTVTKNKANYAYVVTPDNMIYQVKEGDIIGDQHGKVIHIFADRVDIMEEDIEEGRPAMKRIITLQLRNESQ